MQRVSRKETNIHKMITLFIMVQIYLSVEAAPRAVRWSKEFITFSSFGYIAVIFFLLTIAKKVKINRRSFCFFVGVSSVALLAVLVNQDFQPDNYVFLSIVLSGFFVSSTFDLEDYLEGYVRAIIIYSVYSLFATYLLLPMIMRGYFRFFPTFTNFLGTPFVDMGLAYAVKWNGLMRNQGIFREPGVYQFFILVALSIELFYPGRPRKNLNIGILVVTLLSTFSTAGLVSSIPLFFAYIVTSGTLKARSKNTLIVLMLLLTIFIVATINSNIYTALDRSIRKLEDRTGSGSFITRYESIINLIKMSLHNPFFGNSFVYGLIYIQDHYVTYGTEDVTGTMFAFIMALGYPLGLLCIYNFYRFCTCINQNRTISVAIFVALFLSINTQMLIYNTLVWTFLFTPYMRKEVSKQSVINQGQAIRLTKRGRCNAGGKDREGICS